jgi:hypothetical protein
MTIKSWHSGCALKRTPQKKPKATPDRYWRTHSVWNYLEARGHVIGHADAGRGYVIDGAPASFADLREMADAYRAARMKRRAA